MDYKVTIIGAGVIGLAIAAKLSSRFSDILILEKNKKFGQETSSRNSEVIHSGVYYPTNCLKSKLCIEGKQSLYEYCIQKNVNFNKCGKLIVSTNDDETSLLYTILNQAKINGVHDAKILDKEKIKQLEPNIYAKCAIHFPSTGIIDSHGLMKSLETESIINGTQIAYNNELTGLKKIDGGYEILVKEAGDKTFEFSSEIVINASGLNAYIISSMLGLKNTEYQIYYWKGEYFSLGNGKSKLIHSLIYPVPNKNTTGLGIHATIDLNNRVKLGPNAIFLNNMQLNYSVNPESKQAFFDSAKKILPFIELNDLLPDQVGIRPKLQKPGDGIRDFIIKNEKDSGYKNFINLLGIESPGLTSCLSIAKYVDNLIINKD